jgi:hypothetical protein
MNTTTAALPGHGRAVRGSLTAVLTSVRRFTELTSCLLGPRQRERETIGGVPIVTSPEHGAITVSEYPAFEELVLAFVPTDLYAPARLDPECMVWSRIRRLEVAYLSATRGRAPTHTG